MGSEHLNGGETEQQEPQAKCRASASATWPGSGCSGRASCPWCGPRCPGRERAQNTDAGAPPAKGLSPRDPRILSRGAGDPGSARRGSVAKTKGHPGCHLPGLSSRQCRCGCGGREQPGPGVAVGVGQRLEPGAASRAREAPGSLAEAWGPARVSEQTARLQGPPRTPSWFTEGTVSLGDRPGPSAPKGPPEVLSPIPASDASGCPPPGPGWAGPRAALASRPPGPRGRGGLP